MDPLYRLLWPHPESPHTNRQRRGSDLTSSTCTRNATQTRSRGCEARSFTERRAGSMAWPQKDAVDCEESQKDERDEHSEAYEWGC
jgi:hypothetical protein